MPDSHRPAGQIPPGRIQLGVVGRAHGVRGLVRITSHTAAPADLTAYGPLSDPQGRLYIVSWKGEGIAEIARMIDGVAVKVTDRAQAEKLTNTKLFVDRAALPPAGEDEFYLTDLIGMAATHSDGAPIGTVSAVHDYGAGASLEITGSDGPVIVPFTAACVPTVDIAAGRLVVTMPDEIEVHPDTSRDAEEAA